MRILSYLSTLLMAALLTACGGGGGSSGSNPNQPTIFTTAPSTLMLPIGAIREYSVRGGVAPYTLSTDNPRVVAASLSGGVFWINTVGQGTANITVRDNNNGSTAIAVTVGDPLALSIDTVKSYVGDKVRVLITGGTPPFRASTLDTAVSAVINGNEMMLTLLAVSKTDVSVIDALNQQVKMNVEVITGSPQFNLVPLVQTVSENSTQPIYLNVLGGVGGLTVQSSDTNLLKASISGNVVTLTTGTNAERCVPADTAVTITVVDARGAFAEASVVLANNPAGCGLRISSNPVVVRAGSSVKLTLAGISDMGTVSLSSSDPSKATATYSNGVITVTGLGATLVPEKPALPAGCPAVPPGPCTTPAVPAHDEPVTITVIDSGPPTRNLTFKVTVL